MYLLYVAEHVSNCYCKHDTFHVNFKHFNWDGSILPKHNLCFKIWNMFNKNRKWFSSHTCIWTCTCIYTCTVYVCTSKLCNFPSSFREHPTFLFYMLLYTIGIFKSYPGYGDVGLMFALLPLWKHVYQCKASSFFVCSVKAYEQIYKLLNKSCSLFTDMRNTFVTVCMFLVCTVFAPIQYYLWIYAGSANANFYFAISLAFSTAQVFH